MVAIGEFGRSPKLGASASGGVNSPDGRDHWPYCYIDPHMEILNGLKQPRALAEGDSMLGLFGA